MRSCISSPTTTISAPRPPRTWMPGERSRALRGYLLALLAAACWATGGLTAKWLFTQPSPATADWPLPPLGITIDPTALAGGRALSAFLLLAAYLLLRDRAKLRVDPRKDLPYLALFGIAVLN
ncbi:MAG: hypothetical protein FDZ75_03020, partial [Actinobacteria bacterium]